MEYRILKIIIISPLSGNALFFSFGIYPQRSTCRAESKRNQTVLASANGCRLPPGVLKVDYLALAMLCISLCVASDASEGMMISTGLILTTRPSNSERDDPSGKESTSMSPVLG